MEQRDINDAKHAIAGLGSLATWALTHQSEIGFFFATTVSMLTAAYLVQGIILRQRDINKPQK